MKETMMTYIHEEKDVCEAIVASFREKTKDFCQLVEKSRPKNWLVLATGSSSNAMLSAKYYIEKVAGISIEIQEPFNFVHYETLKDSIDFVIAVSQSGHSFSTIEALKKVQKEAKIPTVALTSQLNSPIVNYADLVLDIGCGTEHVGFVTKGFTATVLTSMLLGIVTGNVLGRLDEMAMDNEIQALKKQIKEIPSIIEKTEEFYKKHAAELHEVQRFSAIGYGPTVGTAKEFETKFTETVRVPSQGFELEAYMHGPYLEVNSNHGLIFLQTESKLSERASKLKQYFQAYTDHCFTITSLKQKSDEKTLALGLEVNEFISPLVMVIPFQLLSYRIATGKGIDLGIRIFDDFDKVLKSKI
ncbi:SIS domain-containing protein [Heyndrickxia oleronia]|uniref:SIS domain-containing protein n=1 Tax=Heyndrickxia oleronia TaxID=38875 RepID=UPI00203B53CF|nr:SIS domain-containing protein [Heyndrickxia oleronia]MCM3239208.1 SIS domain-containing protein [Heyndrickxia oleronia]